MPIMDYHHHADQAQQLDPTGCWEIRSAIPWREGHRAGQSLTDSLRRIHGVTPLARSPGFAMAADRGGGVMSRCRGALPRSALEDNRAGPAVVRRIARSTCRAQADLPVDRAEAMLGKHFDRRPRHAVASAPAPPRRGSMMSLAATALLPGPRDRLVAMLGSAVGCAEFLIHWWRSIARPDQFSLRGCVADTCRDASELRCDWQGRGHFGTRLIRRLL